MTDKEWTTERLEDMKWVNSARPLTRIEAHEIIEYAQKQTKRVKELEKENKNLEFNLDTTLKNNHEHRLRTANFKEVLQDINENSSCTIAVCYTRKVLEDSE